MKAHVINIYSNERRIRYVETNLKTKAIKLYPWAQHVLRMKNGFWCFEDVRDYNAAKEDLINGVN